MAADPYGLMNRALARGRGRGGGGRGYGRRKVRDPYNAGDAAYLRAMYPDFDELMGDSEVDYRTMCKTDADFARKFALPPLLEATSTFRSHSDSVDAVAWGPESGQFLSVSHDKTLKVWDLNNRKCTDTLTGHAGGIYHCAVARSGRHIVSCGTSDAPGKNVLIWQWPQKRVLRSLDGHKSAVHHVTISRDSQCVSTADRDGIVLVHDLAKGDKVYERNMHAGVTHGSAFCWEDDRLLVTFGRDGNLHVMDIREPPNSGAWNLPSAVANSVFVRTALGVDTAHDGYDVYGAEFVQQHIIISGGADNKVKRWDLRKVTGQAARGSPPLPSCVEEFLGHSGAVRSLAVTDDLRLVASGCEDGSLRLWECGGTKPAAGHHEALRSLVGHVGLVSGCAWKGSQLLSCSWDQSIRLYDVPTKL